MHIYIIAYIISTIPSETIQSPQGPEKISLKLLVADDDPGIINMLKLLLGRFYSDIETVIDGQALMSKFSDPNFDAEFIITDNTMPGVKGIDAIKKIRETNKTIPIILYTTDVDGSLAPAAKEMGAVFLTKPASLSDLRAVIEHLRIKKDSDRPKT